MHPLLNKRLWLFVFFVLSIVIGGGVIFFRSDRPGKPIETVLWNSPQGHQELSVPFSFPEKMDSEQVLQLKVPLDVDGLTSPSIAIVRPLYFVEVYGDGKLLTAPLSDRIGRDVLLLPLAPNTQELEIHLQGGFETGGLDDSLLLGNYAELTEYFRIRSMTSVFLLTILLSTAVSMFLLVLFRPLQEVFLSVGAFSLALAFNVIGNADVWFVLSNSVEWQLRFKAFAVACSIGFSFYMLSTFTQFPMRWSRKAVLILLLLGLGNFVVPTMEAVVHLRTLLDVVSIPFILMTVGLFVVNIPSASTEMRYYYGASSLLLVGGVLDLMSIYDMHLLPPMMPVASVLFMVGMTMFFVVESSSFSERYRTVVRESQDAIVIVNKKELVVDSNPIAQALNLDALLVLKSMLEQGELSWIQLTVGAQEFTCVLSDPKVYLECHSTPLEQDRALLVFRDVTRQRMEAQQALERVRLETVERVSGGVAHDFNNLFMALNGQMTLLSEVENSDVRTRVQNMEALLSNGSHAIERLQSFIRGETPTQERRLLQEWLKETEQLIQSVLPEHTTLHWLFPPVYVFVNIHPKELEQVLVNIVFNARDAMLDYTRMPQLWIEVSCSEDNQWVDIAIEDAGPGIPQLDRQKVFQPFISSKGPHGGKGLGLSIVQEGVQGMGGTVKIVDGQHGDGARFLIRLPCVVTKEMVVSESSDGKTILVLEDELLIREVLETFLNRGGYTVLSAGTVEEAEQLLHQNHVHCIVSDVLLGSRPQDNGIAFCKQAVEQGYLNPIVIVSGYIPERDGSMGKSWYFLPKPFRYSELLTLLDGVFDERLVVNALSSASAD